MIFRNQFHSEGLLMVEKQVLQSTKQYSTMKAIYTSMIASALVTVASAQAPEGPKPERKGPQGGPPAEMIAKFDKDGDGKLSDEEKKAMMEARKKQMLTKFDKDGDGKLSDEEKKAMREAMGGRPGGPGRPGGKKKPE
jgi:hypothetical protein